MQFFGKNWQNLRLAPPPTGNPGSAPRKFWRVKFLSFKHFDLPPWIQMPRSAQCIFWNMSGAANTEGDIQCVFSMLVFVLCAINWLKRISLTTNLLTSKDKWVVSDTDSSIRIMTQPISPQIIIEMAHMERLVCTCAPTKIVTLTLHFNFCYEFKKIPPNAQTMSLEPWYIDIEVRAKLVLFTCTKRLSMRLQDFVWF